LGPPIDAARHVCLAMAIVPCSTKTLAGVAHGLSRNLVERAADVMLKERRRLVMVPRETPMSLPQLRNMVLCAEAGAIILPAMPAFYHLPSTIRSEGAAEARDGAARDADEPAAAEEHGALRRGGGDHPASDACVLPSPEHHQIGRSGGGS